MVDLRRDRTPTAVGCALIFEGEVVTEVRMAVRDGLTAGGRRIYGSPCDPRPRFWKIKKVEKEKMAPEVVVMRDAT